MPASFDQAWRRLKQPLWTIALVLALGGAGIVAWETFRSEGRWYDGRDDHSVVDVRNAFDRIGQPLVVAQRTDVTGGALWLLRPEGTEAPAYAIKVHPRQTSARDEFDAWLRLGTGYDGTPVTADEVSVIRVENLLLVYGVGQVAPDEVERLSRTLRLLD